MIFTTYDDDELLKFHTKNNMNFQLFYGLIESKTETTDVLMIMP